MAEERSYRTRSMQRMIKRRKKIKLLTVSVVSLFVVILATVLIVKLSSGKKDGNSNENNQIAQNEQIQNKEGVIEAGVFIETVDVGEMDYNAAMTALDEYIASVEEKSIDIDVNGTIITTDIRSLGLECDRDAVLSEAFSLEDEGVVEVEFNLNDKTLEKVFEDEEGNFTKPAKNASLVRENGVFKVINGKKGKEIDIEATKAALLTEINGNAETTSLMQAVAVINEIEPEYTAKDVKKCKDELGKFSTIYKESQISRSANVKNAVSFINGKVVYPGETFSVADAIYPLTSDNGYAEAPSYAGGQVVDSLGGGVCQVSTTLYNAVLLAELEIAERSPHSMVVTYVKPSMDAAIAGDYKDFKFTNNSSTPVYLQGSAAGGVLTFTVYGEETRPASRTIKYVSEIVETIEPGKDIVTKDKTKPKSYEKVTQEAHVGYVANLYKYVYENGSEVEKIKINYSRYKAEPKYVIKGTKKEKKKDKVDDEDTKEPQATKAPETNQVTPTQPSDNVPAEPTPVVENPTPTQPPVAEPTAVPEDVTQPQ